MNKINRIEKKREDRIAEIDKAMQEVANSHLLHTSLILRELARSLISLKYAKGEELINLLQ